MPDLEERVAALEAMLANPSRWFILPAFPALTPEQEAELRGGVEAALEAGPYTHRILPPPPPLTSEQVRQLLRECVTIVKPGETLVVRVPWTTTPTQLREYQRAMDSAEGGVIPFRVLVVAGDELGVRQAADG